MFRFMFVSLFFCMSAFASANVQPKTLSVVFEKAEGTAGSGQQVGYVSQSGAPFTFLPTTKLRFSVESNDTFTSGDTLVFEVRNYQSNADALLGSTTQQSYTLSFPLHSIAATREFTLSQLFGPLQNSNEVWYLGVYAEGTDPTGVHSIKFNVDASLNLVEAGVQAFHDPTSSSLSDPWLDASYPFAFNLSNQSQTPAADLVDNQSPRRFSAQGAGGPNLGYLDGYLLHGGYSDYAYTVKDNATQPATRKWVLYQYAPFVKLAEWDELGSQTTRTIQRQYQGSTRAENQYILQSINYDSQGVPASSELTGTDNLPAGLLVFEIGEDPHQDPNNGIWVRYEGGGQPLTPPELNPSEMPVFSDTRLYIMPYVPNVNPSSYNINLYSESLYSSIEGNNSTGLCLDETQKNCYDQFSSSRIRDVNNWPFDVRYTLTTQYGLTEESPSFTLYDTGGVGAYLHTFWQRSPFQGGVPSELEAGDPIYLRFNTADLSGFGRFYSLWMVGDNGAVVRLPQERCHWSNPSSIVLSTTAPQDMSIFDSANSIWIRAKMEWIEDGGSATPCPAFVNSYSATGNGETQIYKDTDAFVKQTPFQLSPVRVDGGEYDVVAADGSVNFQFLEQNDLSEADYFLWRWSTQISGTTWYWNNTAWTQEDPGFGQVKTGTGTNSEFNRRWGWNSLTGEITPGTHKPFQSRDQAFFTINNVWQETIDVTIEGRLQMPSTQLVPAPPMGLTLYHETTVPVLDATNLRINTGGISVMGFSGSVIPADLDLSFDTNMPTNHLADLQLTIVTATNQALVNCGSMSTYFNASFEGGANNRYRLIPTQGFLGLLEANRNQTLRVRVGFGDCQVTTNDVSLTLEDVPSDVAGFIFKEALTTQLTATVGQVSPFTLQLDIGGTADETGNIRLNMSGPNGFTCVGQGSYFAISRQANLYTLTPTQAFFDLLNTAGTYQISAGIDGNCGDISVMVTLNPEAQGFRVRFHYNDHLNSTTMAQVFQEVNTATSQTITLGGLHFAPTRLANYAYAPYGDLIQPAVEQDRHAPRYTGHEYDSFSGFNYMKGRYQHPGFASFNRPDPKRDWNWEYPHSINLYQYVRNNPLIANDPDGELIHIGIGALVGAIGAGAISVGADLLFEGEINWQKAGAAALNGGITGGAAAATGGTSLMVQIGGMTTANLVGGALERKLDGDEETEVFSGKDIMFDVIFGVAGGRAMKKAEETHETATHLKSTYNLAKKRFNKAKNQRYADQYKKQMKRTDYKIKRDLNKVRMKAHDKWVDPLSILKEIVDFVLGMDNEEETEPSVN